MADPIVTEHLSPNYGQRTRPPKGIVDHIMSGSIAATREWFCGPATAFDEKGNPLSSLAAGEPVSAHYGVGKDGSIDKYVPTTQVAWHCGAVNQPTARIYNDNIPINPNEYLIGIEHEGQPGDVMPEAQYQATLWLHRRLIEAYNIPVDRYRIIGHYELDSVNRAHCPGDGFPWDRLMADLTTAADVVGT